jgi:hypothetical protein
MLRYLKKRRREWPGQAMVEFALILPLFLMVLMGVIVLGIVVFYNQQLTNAAREAARFAAVHSATAQCPVVGHLDPAGSGFNGTDADGRLAAYGAPPSYVRCDTPPNWPQMTAFGRSKVFGMNAAAVNVSACWSGYRTPGNFDAPPTEVNPAAAWPVPQCTIGGADPTTNASAIGCAPGLGTVDTASDISSGQGRVVANRVTVYTCYQWSPPMAGFLLIPQTITFRAVISEPIQRQQ